LEKRHGRIETREYFLETDMERLVGRADWTELNAMGAARSKAEENGEIHCKKHYFITSLLDISTFSKAVRRHWGIDNNLHWRLDATFREDSSRVGKDNAPLNLNVTRKTALPLLKSTNLGRIGIKKKMFRAALPVDSPRFISTGKK